MNFKKNLKRFMTLNRHHAEGFTLVELIVVIAILAILGGVAVPAYGGYVKKAERANDEALLSAINKAFVSTCMMHGENNFGRKDVTAELNNGSFTYTAPFADTFAGFYEGGTFKVFEALIYDRSLGCFKEASAIALSVYNLLKDHPELEKLLNSDIASLGAETLLNEVASLLGWATDPSGLNLQGGAGYNKFFAELLGIDTAGKSDDEIQMLIDEEASKLDDPQAYAINAMALYAGQNATSVTLDGVREWFGKGESDFTADGSSEALGEAAAMYSLYISYKTSIGEDYSAGADDAGDIFFDGALKDEGFQAWLNDPNSTAQAELDAFQAAMTMTGTDGVNDAILENGFDDPELVAALGALMGS